MKKKKITVLALIIIVGTIYLTTKVNGNVEVYTKDIKDLTNKSLAVYIEQEDETYKQTNSIPTSGYTLNETKSTCSNGTIPKWENNSLKLTNLSKNYTNCYLYFDILPPAKDTILANVTLGTETPDFSKTSCSSGCGEATVGLYTAQDDDGTSYYFRGSVTDNYVKFAGFYWRIVRINGDGSIRLIYDGITPRTNGTSGTDAQIETSVFNSSNSDNMYVGYTYTSGEIHGLGTSSTIKEELDKWYESNLKSYISYIDTNAGFCGDRTEYTDTAGTTVGGGTGTTTTYYGARIRLVTNRAPVLTCSNNSDLYTTENSNKGNKVLTYPIGLITADEVAYAGGTWDTPNTSYYLYSGHAGIFYWTMSPNSFSSSSARMFYVYSDGYLGYSNVNNSNSIRPVINLKANTSFKDGSLGTIDSPYIIEGAE